MRWTLRVVFKPNLRNSHRILDGKREGKGLLGDLVIYGRYY
jgi:hypothetical protein